MTPTPQAPAAAQPSALPIVALVLGLLGCVPLLGCVGAVLGLIGVIAAVRNPAFGRIGFSVGALVAGLGWMVLMAGIAVPNFIRFQSRSKQSECRTNLKAAITAERAWFAEHDAYEVDPQTVGFVPEHGNRYLYRLGNGAEQVIVADAQRHPEVDNVKLDAAIRRYVPQVGVTGHCPDCSITIACAGNIDSDDELDVWSISSTDRGTVLANLPHNDFSDVTGEPGE